jgi:adenylate cyclase
MEISTLSRDKSGASSWVPWIFAAIWSVIAVLVSMTPAWQLVEFRLLDGMMVASAPNKSTFPITIIGIDDASMAEMKMQWPWPRRTHAELIDQLVFAGATMIVFDVLFDMPARDPEDDKLLAEAIKRAGNVVMVAGRIVSDTGLAKQFIRVDPIPAFTGAGAQTGFAHVPLDPDHVVRKVPTEAADSLWRTVAIRLMQKHPEIRANTNIKEGSLIRYAGVDHTFPYVSYHHVINGTGKLPKDFFKDSVVIVGRNVQTTVDIQSEQSDLFQTPFFSSTRSVTPGAEVHANIIETSLGDRAITPLNENLVYVLMVLVAAGSAFAMRRWRPLLSLLIGAAMTGAIAAVVWLAFVKVYFWVPAASMVTIIAMMYISLGAWSFLLEQGRRKEITQAFSLYVTPQVVNYLIAHPEQIKLGGEHREVTLMFTDLAGFTTISESLSAERVTHLLNRHFTAMTDIVLEYQGTVAHFIGDAIFAFWGAPLPDEDQAFRAVSASIAMQKGMELMRAELASENLPPIFMRVGIHSGSPVVGNLGSEKRFEYTAIGDDVNLASRLEGTNKRYSTGIIVSGETAKRIAGRIPLRLIDSVRVKGKSKPVEIFTPCENPTVIELTTQALQLYWKQDWDASELLFRELLEIDPDDRVVTLKLEEIAEKRIVPPVADWDGSAELDKM